MGLPIYIWTHERLIEYYIFILDTFVLNFCCFFCRNKSSGPIVLIMCNIMMHNLIIYHCKISIYYLDFTSFLSFYDLSQITRGLPLSLAAFV
jgi:hypothetical protein